MDNLALQRVKDVLEKNDKIAILVGKNPTLDDMAGALSLSLTLSQLRKKVTVASPNPVTVELSSLVGIDKVKTSIESTSGDLVVSFPYKEGEIEKVSYTIESGFLNIVVKAGEHGLTFQERDVKYTRGGGLPSLIIVVGTSQLSDLGSLFKPEALKDTTVVNIDNKANNQGFGDVVFVSQKASAVSELIAQVIQALGVDPDVDIAQNLLSGIAFATDNFQNAKAGFTAFEMAAALMRKGALRTKAAVSRNDEQSQQQMSQFVTEHAVTSSLQNQTGAQSAQQVTTPPLQNQQPQRQFPKDRKPPSDWLTPKVYKGSTNLE